MRITKKDNNNNNSNDNDNNTQRWECHCLFNCLKLMIYSDVLMIFVIHIFIIKEKEVFLNRLLLFSFENDWKCDSM